MAAILQTAGPVSTYLAINSNWKFLNATAHDFHEAAAELEEIGLGIVICTGTRRKSAKVFLKKNPSEVQDILAWNLDLCDADFYQRRFSARPSKKITWNIRSYLVSKGLVSKKQFM